jgi:hypothetical protein
MTAELPRNSLNFMEPKRSLLRSKEPTADPDQNKSSPQRQTPFSLKIQFNIILPTTFGTYKFSLYLRSSYQTYIYMSHLFHACYMSQLSDPASSDHPYNVWQNYKT